MVRRKGIPADPLSFIKRCVQERRVLWTYHVNMRMQGRFISRQTILESVASYEIIESYPEDKYLPSYLVRASHEGAAFHVLFAVDTENENVRVVTAYRPDLAKWSTDLRRRKP
jgi:hypothetical protein